jgi:hypothetical protein
MPQWAKGEQITWVTNFYPSFWGVWFERFWSTLPSQEEIWVALGASFNLSLRAGVLSGFSIASGRSYLFYSLRSPPVHDKRVGGAFTTKPSPMWGITAPFLFLSTVWTLFFAASRFHHVVATTASPSFLPQVRALLPSHLIPLHLI